MKQEYKGYIIEGDGTFGMKHIKNVGRGALPKTLKGAYTDTTNAIKAIENYLRSKGVDNGEASTAG